MVSDSELVTRLREILRSSDLDTATAGSIRRQLEGELGVSLNERKAFIREQIDIFIQTHFSQPQNDHAEQHQEEQEEEGEEEKEDDDDDNEEKEEENENAEQEVDGEVQSEVDEEEQEEEESDDEGSKKKRLSNRSDKIGENVKRKAGGFSKPCALSPQLQELVGEPELARTEVVKKIWAYIREKNLQNPNNKRKIICDKTLRGIFQVDTVDMFKMNKLLSKHIWPIDTDDAVPVKPSPKARQKKQGRQEDIDEPKQQVKRQKGQTSGFLAPLSLSDALVKFFGTGESELSRGDVVKRIWKYIKENELQDPSDKRKIICDEKLKELFKINSFNGFTMTKLLTAHFIKAD